MAATPDHTAAPLPYLARMVFEDTLRLSGYALGMIVVQRITTGQFSFSDKVAIIAAGMTGSLLYHVFLNPAAEHTVRPHMKKHAVKDNSPTTSPSP